MYKEVKSEFIRNLIRQTSFRNLREREYIDELIALERFIVDGAESYASALRYHYLKRRYRKEWEAIYKELKPEEFRRIIEREKKEEEESRRRAEEEKRRKLEEELKKKDEWLAIGGLE